MTATTSLTRSAIQAHLDSLTKPLGSLGELEGLAARIALLQNTLAISIAAPRAFVFAGDHGAADSGVSAYPKAVTAQMVGNYLAGGAAINVLSRVNAFDLTVVDAGVDAEFAPHPLLAAAKVRRGTRNYLHEPAMTAEEYQACLAHADRLVASAAAAGSNTLLLGEMGIGNTASAALLMHYLSGQELSVCVGRGTGLDDAGLARKLQLLRTAVARRAAPASLAELMCEYGGYEIAMLAGAIVAAARRRMLVLVDGFTVTTAAAFAIGLEASARDCCVYAHCSAERGHRALLEHLGARPLLDIGMRLGEGSGAGVALPLVRAAVAMFTGMATFAGAGVSERA
jgi:nicotinate-nucleotide--dimethylbenzimidazole phosphoribosyltransferase